MPRLIEFVLVYDEGQCNPASEWLVFGRTVLVYFLVTSLAIHAALFCDTPALENSSCRRYFRCFLMLCWSRTALCCGSTGNCVWWMSVLVCISMKYGCCGLRVCVSVVCSVGNVRDIFPPSFYMSYRYTDIQQPQHETRRMTALPHPIHHFYYGTLG